MCACDLLIVLHGRRSDRTTCCFPASGDGGVKSGNGDVNRVEGSGVGLGVGVRVKGLGWVRG